MEQPSGRAFPALPLLWLLMGLAMLGVGSWVGTTRFGPLLSGHPLTLVVAFGCVLVGAIAVALSVITLLGRRRPASADSRPRGRGGRIRLAVLAAAGLVVCLMATALLGWSRPFAATERATAALASTDTVAVTERLTSYDLVPSRRDRSMNLIKPTTGLVFYPGARVDARAYAAQLRPLAEAGYLVVVLKEPFGLALLDANQAESIPELHPEIVHWAVGGHSLGGVAASRVADQDREFAGLVLYASQPASKLDRVNLVALSVFGSNDGLQTPAKIESSKSYLPQTTRFVAIKGGVHAFFGDYGDQPGDGQPTIGRAAAQATTAKATISFLAALTPAAKPKR